MAKRDVISIKTNSRHVVVERQADVDSPMMQVVTAYNVDATFGEKLIEKHLHEKYADAMQSFFAVAESQLRQVLADEHTETLKLTQRSDA